MKNKHSGSSRRKPPTTHRRIKSNAGDEGVQIYGIHAASAALSNPQRTIRAVYATPNATQRLSARMRSGVPEPITVSPKDLDRKLGADTVHQGILIEADPLPQLTLSDLSSADFILVLDQITDPHNVGAILRSAAAFGVDALLMTARNSPPLQGTLAKSASGGLEHVPVVLVPNLARALTEAEELGFTRIGLDSGGELSLEDADPSTRLALVLGAEHRGLRQLTRDKCDAICALTTFGPINSLNVSNAAAISLHLMAHKMRNRSER